MGAVGGGWHVARMGRRGIQRVERPEGKRPRGIHRLRWVDNIKINLKGIALECMKWINMIRDGLL